MPMWQIYHHADVFSDDDKAELAERITALYSFLPAFYVNVHFHDLSRDAFFNGRDRAEDFVSIQIDQLAGQMEGMERRKGFVQRCKEAIEPTIKRHNLRWEFYVDETPPELWLVNGLIPPVPDSEAGRKWKKENRATYYEGPSLAD